MGNPLCLGRVYIGLTVQTVKTRKHNFRFRIFMFAIFSDIDIFRDIREWYALGTMYRDLLAP